MSFLGILEKIASPILSVVDKAVPDRDLREKLKHEIHSALMVEGARELEASRDIIVAEAQVVGRSAEKVTKVWKGKEGKS